MKTKTLPLKNYLKYRKLKKLVDEWTRAEVMSRSPAIAFPEYGEYYKIKMDKADEIRMLMYGTSDLLEIGARLGLPVKPPHLRKKHVKKANHKKFRHTRKA
jgi:hypothetical protein